MKQCLKFLFEGNRIADSRIEGMSEKEINIFIEDAKPKEILEAIEERSGIYVIVGKKIKYQYPNGDSKVIYIGTSDNLHKRLTQHIRHYKDALADWTRNELWSDSRYNYIIAQGETRVYYLYTRGEVNCKDLESRALECFYDRYRAIPVGNGARSFRNTKK